jgi:uncharacterized protein (DUF433 family)
MVRPVALLDAPLMPAREAARQLQIPPATLSHWLEGGTRRGRFYEPVLRPEPTGDLVMTWGEFVEARYLRSYRAQTSMQRLRPFIKVMREEFEVPYPLAHFRPFVDANRNLLFRLQEQTDLPSHLWVVMQGRHGQLLLNPSVEKDYLDLVDFAEDEGSAERIKPLGKRKAVVLDPRISSGAATVRGVRTAVILESHQSGLSVEDVADEFDLTSREVQDALAFEWLAPVA